MARKHDKRWSDPAARTGTGAYARAFDWFRGSRQRRQAAAAREQELDERARAISASFTQLEEDLRRLREEDADRRSGDQ